MRNLIKQKKGIMGPIISVFVMVLVISILAGLTFLFVAQLKTQIVDTTTITGVVTNESGAYVNTTGYTLEGASAIQARSFGVTAVWVNLSYSVPYLLSAENYTVSTSGVLTNATIVLNASEWGNANVSYNYKYISDPAAYTAVNTTETAGSSVVNYLALIFLAVIFGAILTIVLRIILPYINLGQNMGGF